MDPEGMQPWQVFTAMFAAFWAISAYFDHFLMTGVFCIAFGVVGEIMTKVMYGEKIAINLEKQKEELKNLLELVNNEDIKDEEEEYVSEEDDLLKEPNEEFTETVNVDTYEINEDEEEEEDGPPPLPAKDYDTGNYIDEQITEENDIIDYDTEKNIDEKMKEENNIQGNVIHMKDVNNVEEVVVSQEDLPCETIESINFELTDQTEIYEPDTNIDPVTNIDQDTNIEPDTDIDLYRNSEQNLSSDDPELLIPDNEFRDIEVANESANENSGELLNQNLNYSLQMNPSETVEEIHVSQDNEGINCNIGFEEKEAVSEKEIEIIPSEICPIETNMSQLNVSNDAEEEAENVMAPSEKPVINENGCDIFETTASSESHDNVEDTSNDSNKGLTESNQAREENKQTVSIETETVDNIKCVTPGQAVADVPGNPEIDIDLTDPAVEAAATKIQSAFKGFKSRKKAAMQ